jgi:hypothetical protein
MTRQRRSDVENYCKLRLLKKDGKEVAVGGTPDGKFMAVQSVWNSRKTVEIHIGGVSGEVDGDELVTAVENAMRAARLGL